MITPGRREALLTSVDAPERVRWPSGHWGLTWHRLGPDDIAGVVSLVGVCAAVEQPDSNDMRTDMLGRIDDIVDRPEPTQAGPGTSDDDLTYPFDSLAGADWDGQIRAAGVVFRSSRTDSVEVIVAAGIDPDWRGRGIGKAVLRWQDDRARQIMAAALNAGDAPAQARILTRLEPHLTDRRRLLIAAGYSRAADQPSAQVLHFNLTF